MNELKKAIRPMVLMFAGSCVLCAGIVGSSVYLTYGNYDQFRESRNQLRTSKGVVFTQLDNAEFLLGSSDVLAELRRDGKIGKVEKLPWVKAITEVARLVPVDEFQFEMSPAVSRRIGATEVQRVDVSVSGSVLHDGLIESFFRLLAERVEGGYSFRSFEVNTDHDVNPARFNMTVQICWYSILPASEKTVVQL